jgi:GxxExxY protein
MDTERTRATQREFVGGRRPDGWDGLHAHLTRRVIGAAHDVYRALGSGFLEEVYRKALLVELEALGIAAQKQAPIEVRYRGVVVGQYWADILAEDVLILELKAVEALHQIHEVQLVNYLRATRIELGLLINFGPKLEIKRRILTNDRKPQL